MLAQWIESFMKNAVFNEFNIVSNKWVIDKIQSIHIELTPTNANAYQGGSGNSIFMGQKRQII